MNRAIRYLLSVLFSVAAALPLAAQAADVTLMPVNVRLDRNNDRSTVQVINNGQEPVLMQAEAILWTRVNGQDHDGPTTDLIINPPVFTVQPGATQVLRVGLRRSQELAQEGTYRIILREVPMPQAADFQQLSGSVRVLVTMRVPVYVAPAQVRRSERWQVTRAPDGSLLAQVNNAGNVHLKVAELRLQGPGGEALAAVAQKGGPSVIFPGEQRVFKLPAESRVAQVQVQTEDGIRMVALNDADAPKP
ncbi:molecular chaperone [Pelomonas sp. KK5]|uniref:fimbrial biogenesis chaperone n=1 Tax=Pelomonas sp. KK5 TaxID=1855730 RepID=UPI001301CD58|nr:fimbria/pilus periplasmic chaperone [Pelomonas sp. KK5]